MLGNRPWKAQSGEQREGVKPDDDEGEADAHPLDRLTLHGGRSQGEESGGEQKHDGEHHHRRADSGKLGSELLETVAQSADEKTGSEYEQEDAEDGTSKRGLHQLVKARPQGRQRDDQLGSLAERRIE